MQIIIGALWIFLGKDKIDVYAKQLHRVLRFLIFIFMTGLIIKYSLSTLLRSNGEILSTYQE